MHPIIPHSPLIVWTFTLFCFFSTGCTSEAPVEQPPNIILLMGDDHGWEETGYNGHPYIQTPVLDEMAASGLRMDRFYSGAPSCSPTRGSVITGRHPNRYGTFYPNWSIRPEEISVAQLLGKQGYLSTHLGKWHLGPVKAESPTNPGAMGFDEWLSHDNFFELNPQFSRNGGPPTLFEGESSEILIEEAVRFIDKAKAQKQPFFAVVWFGSPHEPYSGLDKDLALYEDLPESYADQFVTLTSMETGRSVKRSLRDVLQERYAEITAMDRAIGQLRQYLKSEGLQANTVVWYCGDNGVPPSGTVQNSPLRALKGFVYDGGIRVPGIIEWPAGIPTPRATDVPSVTSDMLPTLCELAGASLPDRPLDGVSIKTLITGEMNNRPEPICFWQFGRQREMTSGLEPYLDSALQVGTTPLVKVMDGRYTRSFRNLHHPILSPEDYAGSRAIMDNQYKLVINGESDRDSGKELFDLQRDPAEQNNLLSEYPEIAEQLEQQLSDWQQSVLTSLTGTDY